MCSPHFALCEPTHPVRRSLRDTQTTPSCILNPASYIPSPHLSPCFCSNPCVRYRSGGHHHHRLRALREAAQLLIVVRESNIPCRQKCSTFCITSICHPRLRVKHKKSWIRTKCQSRFDEEFTIDSIMASFTRQYETHMLEG